MESVGGIHKNSAFTWNGQKKLSIRTIMGRSLEKEM